MVGRRSLVVAANRRRDGRRVIRGDLLDMVHSAQPSWQGSNVGFRIDPPSGGMDIDEVEFIGSP